MRLSLLAPDDIKLKPPCRRLPEIFCEIPTHLRTFSTSRLLIDKSKLQQLPDGLHLLCPRTSPEDDSCWFEEDLPQFNKESNGTNGVDGEREQHVQEARERKELLLQGLIIFTYDGPDALAYQNWLKKRLEDQLQCCDICIREYHRGRKELKAKLDE